MSRLGTCASGCSEERLDLVRAAAHDSLGVLEAEARESMAVVLPIALGLVGAQPEADAVEAAYRSLQRQARAALRSPAVLGGPDVDLHQPTEAATTWWCSRCGGVDAPQPCLGICVWRPVEWVDQAVYEAERIRVLPIIERELRLRMLARRLAWVTPRAGQWPQSWRALRSEAEETLGARPPRPAE